MEEKTIITEGEKIPQYKKNTDPEYLISIRERVRALLMERERINDRLLVLYTGGKDSGILKRARRTRLNSMRRAAKGQAYIAKAARAQNASHRLIETLYSAINLRTELT